MKTFRDAVSKYRLVATSTKLTRIKYKQTPFRRYIIKLKHRIHALNYWRRHPEMIPNSGGPGIFAGKEKAKDREFFMKHSDDILSANGMDLDVLAENFDVDPNLPTQQKQEEVLEAMANTYIYGDKEWNKKEIARQKKHFIETIEKTHFVNLTCSILQLNESLVRTWIRTDPEFAASVRSAQVRFGERVAHATLVKAINGDMAAAMYVLKEFKDVVKFVDPQVEDSMMAVATDTSLDNLTLEEQETLLRLTRKAKQKAIEAGEDVSGVNVDYTGQSLIGGPDIESADEKFANLDEDDEEEEQIIDSSSFIQEYSGD